MAGAGTEVSPTDGVNPINEAVRELYSPAGGSEVEIIFFHGLSVDDVAEAWCKTWLSVDGKVLWPKEWLKVQCPKARTLSVSYNSRATVREKDPKQEMYSLGENLVDDIINDAKCGQETGHPVILVGHCLGGIMIKQFILSAVNLRDRTSEVLVKKRIDNFLNNFKGVFFYGTPNHGSPEIEKWAKKQVNPSPLLGLMKVLSTQTQRINDEFRKLRQNKLQKIEAKAYAIFELCITNTSEFNGMIVPEASAREDCDNCYHFAADHFQVCKARSETDPTVIGKLAKFTEDILSEAQQNLEAQRKLEAQRNLEAEFLKFEDLKRGLEAQTRQDPTTSSLVSGKERK